MGDLTLTKIKNAVLQSRLALTIESVSFLGEGDFCRAFTVNNEWVFRFAKHEEAKQSLRREYCLLPELADKIALSIPSPQAACLTGSPELSFIAYPMLSGESFSQEKYLALDEPNRNRCAGQAAEFLRQMHAADLRIAKNCGVPTADYVARYSELLRRARQCLFPIIDEQERKFVEKTIQNRLANISADAFRAVLLHGDFSPDHVLFDAKTQSVTGVIDFGDVVIGDAAQDFLWIYEDYGLDFLQRVLCVYGETQISSFLERIFQFSLLSLIEWAVECQATDGEDLTEALKKLRIMKSEEQPRRAKLLEISAGF